MALGAGAGRSWAPNRGGERERHQGQARQDAGAIQLRAPHARLSWVEEKGDLESVEGSWTLEDLGEGPTRVTYSLAGDPGRVLGTLTRGPLETAIRAMLVNARPGELKARVESA